MTVQHPNGKETKYAYDLLGRKLMVNHPDAGETDMTYDAAGNLLTKLTAELRKQKTRKCASDIKKPKNVEVLTKTAKKKRCDFSPIFCQK